MVSEGQARELGVITMTRASSSPRPHNLILPTRSAGPTMTSASSSPRPHNLILPTSPSLGQRGVFTMTSHNLILPTSPFLGQQGVFTMTSPLAALTFPPSVTSTCPALVKACTKAGFSVYVAATSEAYSRAQAGKLLLNLFNAPNALSQLPTLRSLTNHGCCRLIAASMFEATKVRYGTVGAVRWCCSNYPQFSNLKF